jgi:hypothetical protein
VDDGRADLVVLLQFPLCLRYLTSFWQSLHGDQATRHALNRKSVGAIARVAATLEGYFNTLEVGCSRYLEGEWDKESFKKTYRKDLRMWVEQRENKCICALLHNSDISRYTAIWKVFREWEKE